MGGGFSKALAEHGANVAVFDLNSPLQELVDAGKEYKVKITGYMYAHLHDFSVCERLIQR